MRRNLKHAGVIAAMVSLLTPAMSAEPPERLVGRSWVHVVTRGETLRSIGSRYGIDLQTIAAANGIRARAVLKAGQQLRLDNRHIAPPGVLDGTIVVNVPQRMLFFRTDGELLAIPVAVGRNGWRTPLSTFTIVEKEEDPTWDVPASIAAEARLSGKILPARVPPGPDNPLGQYWMRLSVGPVGLHGTNAPMSLYQAVTHGCIRVHPDDIARLYPRVALGTPGETVYQPILLASAEGGVFVEVHRDIYGIGPASTLAFIRELALQAGLLERVDWKTIDIVVSRREGIARDVTRR